MACTQVLSVASGSTWALLASTANQPTHGWMVVNNGGLVAIAERVASLGMGRGVYTVRKCDTLSTIARRTGSSVVQIKSANGLRSDLIRAGQELKIPGNIESPVTASFQMAANTSGNPGENPEFATSQGLVHQVRRGESLWNIARRYGTSVSHLRAENGLVDDLLKIGQELRISAFNSNL